MARRPLPNPWPSHVPNGLLTVVSSMLQSEVLRLLLSVGSETSMDLKV